MTGAAYGLRQSIIKHMRHLLYLHGHIYHTLHPGGIEDYIIATRMDQNTVRGTDLELFTLAHLLQVDIFTYCEQNGPWQRYKPNLIIVDLISSDSNTDMRPGIYINHPPRHFGVIISA